jgi:hypothetical protein
VSLHTKVVPARDAVRMQMSFINNSSESLRDLRVQNCVMLKGAPEFALLSNENKVFSAPYAACRSATANRWVITAWEPCKRAWGNAPCPCLHSDPQFADCGPGETRQIVGWLSFYQGNDLQAEIRRIDATGWRDALKKSVTAPSAAGK